MSPSIYNAATYLWLGCSVALLVGGLASAIQAAADWRGPSRKRRLVRLAACLGLLPILFGAYLAFVWGVYIPSQARAVEAAARQSAEAESLVQVGDEAPAFTLVDAEGGTFALDRQRGKVVLVNFFATWCGPCLLELPHLQQIWDERREDGEFAMLVVGREETEASVAGFLAEHGFTFPAAADAEGGVYAAYAKRYIPRTYLISRDGRVVFSSVGFYEEEIAILREALRAELAAGE